MWTQAKVYLVAGILIVWSALVLCSGLYVGALSGRLGKANAEQRIAAERLKEVLAGQVEAEKRQKAIQKKLDKAPRSQEVIREVVRENPSGCELPAAVADRLREAIRKANAAREMPPDPVRAEQQRGQVDRERTGPAD